MTYYFKNFRLSKNKFLEFQLTFNEFKDSYIEWFNIQLGSRTKCDHSGFIFRLELFRIFEFDITFYDHRHWDDEKNNWVLYEKETN